MFWKTITLHSKSDLEFFNKQATQPGESPCFPETAIIELSPDDNINTGKMKIFKQFALLHCARYRRVLRSLQAILEVLDFEEQ